MNYTEIIWFEGFFFSFLFSFFLIQIVPDERMKDSELPLHESPFKQSSSIYARARCLDPYSGSAVTIKEGGRCALWEKVNYYLKHFGPEALGYFGSTVSWQPRNWIELQVSHLNNCEGVAINSAACGDADQSTEEKDWQMPCIAIVIGIGQLGYDCVPISKNWQRTASP